MVTMIKQYIKDNKKKRIGVMVAFTQMDHLYIGFSKCNKKDDYNPVQGDIIAVHRALNWSNYNPNKDYKIPKSIEKDFYQFIERCKKYYKDKTFPKWVLITYKNLVIKECNKIN